MPLRKKRLHLYDARGDVKKAFVNTAGIMSNHSDKHCKKTAPQGPGAKANWAPAAKAGVGCAISSGARLRFTLSRGIVTEIYFPSIDNAAIRDCGLLVSGPGEFFSEEKNDCTTNITLIETGVPMYLVENECAQGRYRITKEIIIDPQRDVLLQRLKFFPGAKQTQLRLYVLLSPRLGNQGDDNSGWVGSFRDRQGLFAQYKNNSLALLSSAPWLRRSVGYVGTSDAWQDIRKNGGMTWEYACAEHGHIALAGEIDLKACKNEFILALSLNHSPHAAALNAVLSLNSSFDEAKDTYIRQWRTWHKQIASLDKQKALVKTHAAERQRPDYSRPHTPKKPGAVSENIFRSSMMALRTHRSFDFQGAGVASLCVPWGEVRGDDPTGYHLVWPRDLADEALGLLAGGAGVEVLQTLDYFRATQKKQGGWPQNMWVDGSAYSDGVQLDEAAIPVLLLNIAHRTGTLPNEKLKLFWPMVRAAAAFVVRSGPATQEDRWENADGLTPYTLATEIASLLIAARFADRFKDPSAAKYFRETADLWNDLIEPWTYVQNTPLAKRIGVDGYYVRIAPSPGMDTLLRRPEAPRSKLTPHLPITEVVSPDALAFVRFGLRAADDPRILNTIKVIDAINRAELPAGPSWRRYTADDYGEHDDGQPFAGFEDKAGHGRAWPLLTGERGHYEVAAGDIPQAKKMLHAMNGFASQTGLISEQVWDAPDIPARGLFRGRATGSAMPLAWAHSEYVRLLRSIQDRRVFDRPDDTFNRYVKKSARSNLALWRFDHQPDFFYAGKRLRIETMAPAVVHFSTDGWNTKQDLNTRDTQLGFHCADLPTEKMNPGNRLTFTFRWSSDNNRWEGKDFQLSVETPPASMPPVSTAQAQPRNRKSKSRKTK